LLDALRRLPVDQQIMLELYHFEELTAPELATMYGVTEVAVRGRLHRAKEALLRAIERIADSSALVRSTLADFETWARELREEA
jgi:DNA-directed RNA polymerase specialized sigma24 family protein